MAGMGEPVNIEPLSQRDPRWAMRPLGTSPLTIYAAGCLLTCCTMVARWAGMDVEPGELNALLNHVEGYEDGNLLRWYAVPKVTPMRLEALGSCPLIPAPLDAIGAHLDAGRPVIVQIQNPIGEHWVLLTEKWQYIDPFDATTKAMQDPARAILAWAVYTPKD